MIRRIVGLSPLLLLATSALAGAQPGAEPMPAEPMPAGAPMPATEPQPPPPPEQASPFKRLTITWSPIHLVLPIVELAGEYIVSPKLGLGVVAGAGRVTDSTDTVTATATEVGAQANYYVLKPAAGLHVGGEVIYMHVGDVEQDATLTAAGLSLGPYVGYKLVTSIGFTFVAQLGAQFLVVKAKNATQMAEDKDVFPLLNLNVGWSF